MIFKVLLFFYYWLALLKIALTF